MKKKLFLLLILFLTSGCSVNYNLTIDNDTILEDINISIPIDDTDEEVFEDQVSYDRPVYVGNGINYDMTTNEDDDNYYVNYKYKHDIKYFTKSSFLNTCYVSNDIDVTDDEISISTSNVFRCITMDDGYRADSVNINITTKLKVLEHNADKVSGNTYTWHMDGYEYSDKAINLVLQKDKTLKESITKSIDNIENKEIIIISILILLLGGLLYFVVKRKQAKRNEI